MTLAFIFTSCGGGGGGGSEPSAPAPQNITVSLTSSADSAEVNSSITLTWSSTLATICSASGAWSGSKGTSGSESITIGVGGSNTFSLSCSATGANSGSASTTVNGLRYFDGKVFDGYIRGAEVFVDTNDNLTVDANEASVSTDNQGDFTKLLYNNGTLVSIGGIDSDTGADLSKLTLVHKLEGYAASKLASPFTTLIAYMSDASTINAALGIDASIDLLTTDPIPNLGEGIYDLMYEKGNQLTVLSYTLQNHSNAVDGTSELYFQAIADQLEESYAANQVTVDIEDSVFISNVINKVETASDTTFSSDVKTNLNTVLSSTIPLLKVYADSSTTSSVQRFAFSTLQNDVQDSTVMIGNASSTLLKYENNVFEYVATDQGIDEATINPDYNFAPSITSSASFSAAENQTAIGSVTATDADGDSLTYSISGSEINISSSGVLTFASAPDYETKNSYTATVTVSDGTDSVTQAITVNITDVDEAVPNSAPSITSSATFSAAENQTSIGTVTATDADGDSLTYSLSGTDASSLSINSSSGVMTFKTAPDYETKSTYTATVTASDGSNTSSQDITVTVTDIVESLAAPVFTSDASFSAAENQTSIGTVTATDADGDNVTFSVSGSELSINSSSGVLTFVSAPDYETKSTYTATVTASDGVNTTTQSITVAVTYVCTSQCLYVDQSAINQYSQNNYAHFNSYNFTGEYQGNTANNPPIPDPSDKITLPGTTPVLGNQFTLEAMVYSKAHPMLIHRTIIGDDSNPASNDRERPPTITFNQVNGVNQIRYGFGVGPDSKGKRRVVNTEMTEDEWYHVAVTFDGTTSKLYLDGIEIDSSNFASGLTPHPVPITTIGRKFLGKIDEVRIWNLVRSQGEIQAAMNGSLAGDESGLVAYYPMEINENWKLIDRSPNDNHASMVDVEILQRYSSQNCTSPDGSELCPFIKIRDALESAEGGNGILVKEGKYSEVLYDELINYSYETEAPRISITGENDNVRLDGTIELNADWVFSNGRYTAQVDLFDISKRAGIKVEDIYGLWVNDRYMIPAMPINISNPTDVTTSVQNNPESGTVFALPLTTPYYYPGPHDLELQDPYIVGDINNLDAAEEWSFDKENKILYLIAGDNIPNDTNVRVRIRTSILSLEYSDNLTFKNLSFFAGTFRFHRSSYVLLEDSRFSHSWDVGMSYEMPTVRTIDELANYFHKGIHNTVRNSIFEYINDLFALKWWGSMYPLGENILFQYNDWFENTVWAPGAADNFQGASKWSDAGAIIGGSTFRYITMDQNHTGGIQPGLESLIEYARIENQYINIDGSGIQRTVGDTIGSTTRYSWLLNTNRNGMRWDSGCAGINGVAHNVVSAGNKRGFRLKGDKHRAFHLLSYDNNTNGISMPKNKFCGEAWNNQGGENMLGNLNSRLLNSINEKSLTANTPDAGDPSITGGQGGLIAQNISNEFLLNQSGIWFGEALDADHVAPFVYPHLELQDPWFENRRRSVESLESQFGVNPFTDVIQDYDFRPRKGSPLLDGGVVIPGINNGQDDDPSYPFNHPPSYSGQHRAFVGDAPDIGPYEHGDSVYWIPGFRYSYPSVPIPSNGAVDVPIDYSVMFNYPWRTDYSNTTAVVNIEGPGVNVTTTLNYPENVVFATFSPGETYNWSVTVDGVSSGNWTFTVADKIYPLNDRSFDISAADAMLIPRHNKSLQVEENVLSYLRFDIPESINVNDKIYLNITPEQIDSLDGAIVLYKYNYQGWSEKLNEKNLGVIDHSLLTFLESFSNINAGSAISIDITDYINSTGEHSFALGTTVSTDKVSFYSKEKFVTDGVDIVVSPGDLLGPSGNGSGYAPQIEVWPSLSF